MPTWPVHQLQAAGWANNIVLFGMKVCSCLQVKCSDQLLHTRKRTHLSSLCYCFVVYKAANVDFKEVKWSVLFQELNCDDSDFLSPTHGISTVYPQGTLCTVYRQISSSQF